MKAGGPEFNLESSVENLDNPSFAILISRWNIEFNEEMLLGARDAFNEAGIAEDRVHIFYAPGAFEMPLLALELAETANYDAVLCFATIIKGDTAHFDIVANESARGIMDVGLNTGIPIMNGILAVNDKKQADERASRKKANKGYEVAMSAMDAVNTLKLVDKS